MSKISGFTSSQEMSRSKFFKKTEVYVLQILCFKLILKVAKQTRLWCENALKDKNRVI